MRQALDTTVNGSAETCHKTADYLGGLRSATERAFEEYRQAIMTGDRTWAGPAHESFNHVAGADAAKLLELVPKIEVCETALKAFANELGSVRELMYKALDQAVAGGLYIDGEFIVSPEMPLPARLAPTEIHDPHSAATLIQKNRTEIAIYTVAVNEYNAQALTYNNCKKIVVEARAKESEAHNNLKRVFGETGKSISEDLEKYVALGRAIRGLATAPSNAARFTAATVTRLGMEATFYKRYALGSFDNSVGHLIARVSSEVNAAETKRAREESKKQGRKVEKRFNSYWHDLLKRGATASDDLRNQRRRLASWERYVKRVPSEIQRFITAYPGQGWIEQSGTHHTGPTPPASSSLSARLLRGNAFTTLALIAPVEGYKAHTGEQSWPRAIGNTGGMTIGSAVATGAVFAAAGPALPPLGMLTLGISAGLAGSGIGSDIVEGFSQAQEYQKYDTWQ